MAASQASAKSDTNVRDVEQEPSSGDEFIHHDHIGHGATPAAWALNITVILGALCIGVGLIAEWWILVWIGVALFPVALVIGVVMKRMGYGVEMDSNAVLRRGEDPRASSGPAIPDETSTADKRKPGTD